MNARHFIQCAFAVAICCTSTGLAIRKPLFEVRIVEWSLHKLLFAQCLNHRDFPKVSCLDDAGDQTSESEDLLATKRLLEMVRLEFS